MTAVAGEREYEIVAYEPRHREGVLDLQTHLWGANRAANAAYLEWKYFRNPYASRAHIYLALHGGQVVGMRGMYGSSWETDGREAMPRSLCAGDLVVLPEHRGRGLFGKLMSAAEAELAREDVAWLFNFSASVPTRLGSLSLGWKSVGPIATMRRERPRTQFDRVARLLRRFSPSFQLPHSHPFDRIDRERRDGGRRDGIVVSDRPRSGAMAELVRHIAHDGRIRHVRDEQYFEWRFGNPRADYRFFFLGAEPLEGYLAIQVRRYVEAPGPVRIVDCEARTPASRAALFAAAAASVDGAALEIWTGTRDEGDRAALRRAGFAEKPVVSAAKPFSTILVRQLRPGPWTMGQRGVLDLAAWDVRFLDSDAS